MFEACVPTINFVLITDVLVFSVEMWSTWTPPMYLLVNLKEIVMGYTLL